MIGMRSGLKGCILASMLALPSAAAAANPAASWKLPMRMAQLTSAQRAAILTAAGFERAGSEWKGCGGTSDLITDESWIEGGAIRDLNNDGRPEVVLGDSSSACYGMTGQGYAILTATDAGWKVVDGGAGIPSFLATRSVGGWQDIEVGGPGFCFPVLRWNGKAYAIHRHEYEGKPCSP